MNITELQHNQTAKETRIRGLIPRWESKSIVFIEDQCLDLVDEMRVFPRGLHDDVLDSLAYQAQVAIAWEPQRVYQTQGVNPMYNDLGI